jgi:hypothetical protein
MVTVAQAIPIIEPNFNKLDPVPPGTTPVGICQGGGHPDPCKPGVEGPGFDVGSGTGWPPVQNDVTEDGKKDGKKITIHDFHLRILEPADAKWADVDGDGKIGKSNLFPNGGTVDPKDPKKMTLVGSIPPGTAFQPFFKLAGAEDGIEVAATISVVPEPATLLLVGTTAAGVGLAGWRRRRRARQERV